MNAKSKTVNSGKHYMVKTCRNGRIEQVLMTKEEKDSLPKDDVDFHYDRTNGDMFIKTKESNIKDYSRKIPFGPTRWEVLEQILLAAGDFVELESENWKYAEIARIRKVFSEKPKKGKTHFFDVQKNPTYAIRWRPKRSWRIIEKESSTGSSTVNSKVEVKNM